MEYWGWLVLLAVVGSGIAALWVYFNAKAHGFSKEEAQAHALGTMVNGILGGALAAGPGLERFKAERDLRETGYFERFDQTKPVTRDCPKCQTTTEQTIQGITREEDPHEGLRLGRLAETKPPVTISIAWKCKQCGKKNTEIVNIPRRPA